MHQERDTRQILYNLGVKADEHGLESLTAKERTILLPWFARGVIGNGGFRYFFEGGHDLAEVAGAFRELGRHAVASACERVGSRFAEQRPKDLAQVNWDQFTNEEDVIYELTWEELLAAIGKFVDQHRDAFAADLH